MDLRPPSGEIITVGDELTSGERLDTNSQWLSQQLGAIGVRVLFHCTVADDERAMSAVIKTAAERANVVVITGGLGPTADDLTRQVMASVAQVPLQRDEAAARHIQDLFRSRGREMPANNLVQAQVPAGAKLIPNPTGTAPGIDMTLDYQQTSCRMFALPGVPAELKPMWQAYVQPAIQAQFQESGIIVHHAIHCFGLAESDVEARLPDLIRRGRVPAVGITATKATITLRITAQGVSQQACQEMIDPTAQLIRQVLGDFVFGENETTLPQVVVTQLQERDQNFAVIDLGGCGLIADWLQAADPEGKAYRGTISGVLPASQPLLDQILAAARQTFPCDHLLVIGPAFTDQETLQRDVWIHSGDRRISQRFAAASNPSILVQRSVKQALNFFRLAIAGNQI